MGDDAQLDRVLVRLVADATITQDQADAVRARYAAERRADQATDPAPGTRGLHLRSALAEVGGYVGAAFVIAAGVAVLGALWDDFDTATRVAPLIGGALILVVAAILTGRDLPRPPRGPLHRLVSVLLLGAAALLSAATGILTEEGLADDVVPSVALVVCLAGYAWQRGYLMHVGLAVSAWSSVIVWLESAATGDLQPLQGVAGFALGLLWAALTWGKVLIERALGLIVGGTIAFVGSQQLIAGDWEWIGWPALLAVTAAGLAGYAVDRELPMLAVGGISLTVLVPEFVIVRTDGALGASGALLISGLLIVVGSVWALRRTPAEG